MLGTTPESCGRDALSRSEVVIQASIGTAVQAIAASQRPPGGGINTPLSGVWLPKCRHLAIWRLRRKVVKEPATA